MTEKNDNQEQLSVDEQAKQQFLEELKNKNMEEKRKLEEFKNRQEKSKLEDELKNVDEGDKQDESDMKDEDNEDNGDKSDDGKEEQDSNKEENGIAEVEDKVEEIVELEDNIEENKLIVKEDKKVSSKFEIPKTIKISVIDTAITSIVSLGILYLFDAILRIAGYEVADMKSMYILIFIIILILYPFIMSKFKYRQTIGQKFS